MDTITFEIKSLLRFKLELIEFPELSSGKKWVQKGIAVLKQYTPRVLRYLSRESILSKLQTYHIILETEKTEDDKRVKFIFKIWLGKEKLKRLILVIIEALLIPFTGFLAILPGPNFFFYVPALLFYYHLTSYLGLRRTDVDELDIEIVHH